MVTNGWSLHQLDVNNAFFFQGYFIKDAFMAQPQGFIDHDHPHHAYKLCRAIYGFKQAPRAWYHELCQFLVTLDSSLFVFNTSGAMIYLLVYVDDIIITCDNNGAVQKFITLLAQCLSIKDLGFLTYFPRVEVTSHPHDLLLSQCHYIKDFFSLYMHD